MIGEGERYTGTERERERKRYVGRERERQGHDSKPNSWKDFL